MRFLMLKLYTALHDGHENVLLKWSPYVDRLDTSEIAHFSYFLGQAVAGIYGHAVLERTFVLHVDRFVSGITKNETRPDLVAFDRPFAGPYFLIEAKGGAGRPSAREIKGAYRQSLAIGAINGSPAGHVATLAWRGCCDKILRSIFVHPQFGRTTHRSTSTSNFGLVDAVYSFYRRIISLRIATETRNFVFFSPQGSDDDSNLRPLIGLRREIVDLFRDLRRYGAFPSVLLLSNVLSRAAETDFPSNGHYFPDGTWFSSDPAAWDLRVEPSDSARD